MMCKKIATLHNELEVSEYLLHLKSDNLILLSKVAPADEHNILAQVQDI